MSNSLQTASLMETQTGISRSAPRPAVGLAVWFTGLSASGKSTLVRATATQLSLLGIAHEVLDADDLRKDLNRDLGFSRKDRDENIRRIAYVASLLVRHGVVVLVAAISPFREARGDARQRIGSFAEVHVDAPLAICEQRDPLGVYRRLRAGEISQIAGVDAPYEPPLQPELHLNTDLLSIDQCAGNVVELVLAYLDQSGEREQSL
jgi:adenylylsulfate kinase